MKEVKEKEKEEKKIGVGRVEGGYRDKEREGKDNTENKQKMKRGERKHY